MLWSWADVKSYIGQRYQIMARQEDCITVGWPVGKPTQWIQVKHAEMHQRHWLFLGAPVWPESKVSKRVALSLNSELLMGSLGTDHGMVMYRHVLAMGRFDERELDEVIEWLGNGVEWFRMRFGAADSLKDLGQRDRRDWHLT